MRTRFALVIIGLALGFAARWAASLLEDQVKEPHFQPMPAETVSPDEPVEG